MSYYSDLLKRTNKDTRGFTAGIKTVTYSNRARQLKKEGFLEFEYRYLAAHEISSKTLRVIRDDRKKTLIASLDAGLSDAEYQKLIERMYRKNHWIFNDGEFSPFRMIDYYQLKYQQADTPQPKRPAKVKNYYKALGITKKYNENKNN